MLDEGVPGETIDAARRTSACRWGPSSSRTWWAGHLLGRRPGAREAGTPIPKKLQASSRQSTWAEERKGFYTWTRGKAQKAGEPEAWT